VSELRLWRESAGAPVESLRPGRDLVFELAPADALRLAPGAALDDVLDAATRSDIDREARERMDGWRAGRTTDLTVDGVDLAHVWEVELMAQCFLPATRLARGLAAVAADGRSSVTPIGLDPALRAVVLAAGAAAGLRVTSGDAERGLPLPIPVGRPGAVHRAVAAVGVPARVRGDFLASPYWHLRPVFARLANAAAGPRPVATGLVLPGLPPREALRVAGRGGWLGHPGLAARRASWRDVQGALERASPAFDGALERAFDGLALAVLRREAGDTLALARHVRRVLHRRPLPAVVPFDSPAPLRVLIGEGRSVGAPSLLVQHGFDARLNDPDKTLADHVALWSEHDRDALTGQARGELHVTGNPGAEIPPARAARPSTGRAVVLVEYRSRLSARIDSRVGMRHVDVALRALEAARPHSTAVVRPHPADLAPDSFASLGAGRRALEVGVDAASPIEVLLREADLCVGAMSTATLQAAASGIPTVFLDVTGVPRPWPFDGAGLPLATDEDSLAAAISDLGDGAEAPGREAAVEALGVRPDAVDRVCDLIASLAQT
jgi:hypothetical protein